MKKNLLSLFQILSKKKLFQTHRFWLLTLAITLLIIQLHWDSTAGEFASLLETRLFFWIALIYLIWEKRHKLNLETNTFSSVFGTFCILLVLHKRINLFDDDPFIYLSPIFLGLGLCLLASGVKGLKQYIWELMILVIIAVPDGVINRLIGLSIITAKFVTFILWNLGFEVSRELTLVSLPEGAIDIEYGCTGLNVIRQLLGLAILFAIMFSTDFSKKVLAIFVAIILAFIVNGMRIYLLAVLISQKEAFDYWHLGTGSLLFSMFAVFIFGCFCWFLLTIKQLENRNFRER